MPAESERASWAALRREANLKDAPGWHLWGSCVGKLSPGKRSRMG